MRFTSSPFAGCLILALAASAAWGQSYDPPANYYAMTTGTGPTLKTQLRTIISNMTGVTYGEARYSAPYTDPNPNASGRILLIYDRASVSQDWDMAATWNREHIWPVSRLGVSDPSTNTISVATDQFNLRPADTDLNSFRGNSPFGMDSTTGGYGYQGTYFYPGDADAGDVARAQFYMATRYSQLSLSDSFPSGTQMGDLSSLINYHFRDVPDVFERRRNHAIYGLAGQNSPAISNPYAQSNRNPYVDHPEFAWSVFVDQMNDSQITIDGATTTESGGSTRNVDLGRVLINAPVPAAQSVTLNKAGVDGTYFQVTAWGQATSSLGGRYNAFRNGATDSRSLSIGLATSTAVAGSKSGAVTIDNLDITTGGGVGHGANDDVDVMNVSLSVLDHANPSFAASNDVNSLSYDFGVVTIGAPAPTFSFDVFNLANTVGFTAGLDLDSITGLGDEGAFSTTLAPFSGAATLAAGGGNQYTATLDTSALGSFSATYTLEFTDDNVPGAASLGAITLTLSGVVEAASIVETADFDADGDVDGGDFLAWQRGLGALAADRSIGDANGDQLVDAEDLAVWSAQFGVNSETSLAVVPETNSLVIVWIVGTGLMWNRRRHGRRIHA